MNGPAIALRCPFPPPRATAPLRARDRADVPFPRVVEDVAFPRRRRSSSAIEGAGSAVVVPIARCPAREFCRAGGGACDSRPSFGVLPRSPSPAAIRVLRHSESCRDPTSCCVLMSCRAQSPVGERGSADSSMGPLGRAAGRSRVTDVRAAVRWPPPRVARSPLRGGRRDSASTGGIGQPPVGSSAVPETEPTRPRGSSRACSECRRRRVGDRGPAVREALRC